VEEKFMEIVIPDGERRTGRLVSTCFDPAGHIGSRGLNQDSRASRLRTSGVIESGGS